LTTGAAFSLVIPVYKNEGSIAELLQELAALQGRLSVALEVVFVVDGSPDACHRLLAEGLVDMPFTAQLLLHARNFGSFAAIRTGLAAATGDFFGVMAADLQEPTELVEGFCNVLQTGQADIAVGQRVGRDDPLASRLASAAFWSVYRRLIQPEMPSGGVDVFGCTASVRDALLALEESNSSLVGLLFWVGYRRTTVPYTRLPRRHGRSAWTFGKKVRYLVDSTYAFSDLPLRILTGGGALAMVLSVVGAAIVLAARLTGRVDVPGYTVIVLTTTFFGGLNALGLGIIGGYVWRTFENTKRRPHALVRTQQRFDGKPAAR
jgi:polyisoprenyl-phosphate glycosyltransferase